MSLDQSEHVYSGFFLCRPPVPQSNKFFAKVAVFKPKSTFRKVLVLETNKKCVEKYGAMIHFRSKLDEDELTENSVVTIIEDVDPVFEHEILSTDKIVHTMKDFFVGAENLPDLNIYHHKDLGLMHDPHSRMRPGKYLFITFEVKLTDTESFSIHIEGGQWLEGENLQKEVIPDESEVIRLSEAHTLIRIEHEYNKNAETAIWKSLGLMTLKSYSKGDFHGWKPIFKICTQDAEKIIMFKTLVNSSEIMIVRQRELEDGTYEDDESVEPQFGTIFAYDHISKKTGEKTRKDDHAVMRLKGDCVNKFERTFNKHDLFRVESNLTNKTEKFWEEQKYIKNEIFKETINGHVYPQTLQNIIEKHEKLPEEFLGAEFNDDGTPKYRLNESQYKAAKMALNENRKLVCIQGPPGTGKTYVLSNVLARLVQKGHQAIVLTPTREALKNIREMTEKMLIDRKIKHNEFTCMDHARFYEAINETEAAKQCIQQFEEWTDMAKKGIMTWDKFDEMRDRLQTQTKREQGLLLMAKVSLVFATVSSAFSLIALRHKSFKPCMCVIDEAAQVKETETWPAVSGMPKIVMAGDPKQLPALVLSFEAKSGKLAQSVMDRILEKKDHFSWTMLEEQYRCHPQISRWSNECFYDMRLIDRVKDELTLQEMVTQKFPADFRKVFDPLVLVDTSLETNSVNRVQLYEQMVVVSSPVPQPHASTFSNIGEARIAIRHYVHLRQAGIPAESIAIITPYRGQADLLREGIDKVMRMQSKDGTFPFTDSLKTTVGTVDSVQGQEYSVVIFSMVRSNPRKTMGFVSDLRRLNVVVTRAKRHFMLIGNGYLMANSHVPEIRKLFDFCKNSGHRFHPDHANLIATPCNPAIQNNFGQDFAPFIEHTRDEEMKKWCIAFVERGKDPAFRQAQFAKKQQRYLEKEAAQQRKYAEQAMNSTRNYVPRAPRPYYPDASRPAESPAPNSAKLAENPAPDTPKTEILTQTPPGTPPTSSDGIPAPKPSETTPDAISAADLTQMNQMVNDIVDDETTTDSPIKELTENLAETRIASPGTAV